jgi:thiol-disulfide isomerase/thioredoxin
MQTMTKDGRSGRAAMTLAAFVAALAALMVAAAAGAQPTADQVLTGFTPTGDYLLEVDAAAVPGAEIFYSQKVGAFLVIASKLPAPVLLWPRTTRVETVHIMKVAKKDDGTVDLLPDAVLADQGTFQVAAQGAASAEAPVTFQVDGHRAALKAKPFLLGTQSAAALGEHDTAYARSAADYTPSAPILSELRQAGGNVRVEVYFGSWCPACKQMVPRIMRVAEELEAAGIDWEFYGLPRPFNDEPRAKERGVTAVPTGIVYRDGKELGRLNGNDWKVPELAIKNLLG